MVEVNFTFWIQAVNFIIILLFLNRFIFKPILARLDERERVFKAMKDEADRVSRDGADKLAQFEQEMVRMRHDASVILGDARRDAMQSLGKTVEESKTTFRQRVETAREQIAQESAAASASLRGEVEGLARAMAEKILGRKM